MSGEVERAARTLALDHYSDRFKRPMDDPHVVRNADGNWRCWEKQAALVIAALATPSDAARKAVVEEAAIDAIHKALPNLDAQAVHLAAIAVARALASTPAGEDR